MFTRMSSARSAAMVSMAPASKPWLILSMRMFGVEGRAAEEAGASSRCASARYATIVFTAAAAGAGHINAGDTREGGAHEHGNPAPASPTASLSSGWSLAFGILLVIAGIVALLFPVMAAVTASLYIGWFALIAVALASSKAAPAAAA